MSCRLNKGNNRNKKHEQSGLEAISMHGICGGEEVKIFLCVMFVIALLVTLRVPPTNVCDVVSNTSLNSDLSQQYTDIKIYPRIITLISSVCEKCHCENIVGAILTQPLFFMMAEQI